MRNSFYIDNIKIGIGEKPLVIPEIGINHGGNLTIAKKMVDAAHRAGARIIKHQTHIVEDEMCSVAQKIIPGNSSDSIYKIMKQCALSEQDEYNLMKYTQSKGMVYISTPFSRAAADRLNDFGISAFKIGSGEMNNYPLLEYIADFNKPIILSTGMNGMADVMKAVEILERNNISYALLHSTNLYPTPARLVRLGAMQEMMTKFENIPIGLSDHTLNNNACIGAIALGATIVERHFTDTKNRTGPDIVCSMDEEDLKELIIAAEEIAEMRGGKKEKISDESITSNFAFATVVSIRKIKKGEFFSKDNVWVKRPNNGGILAKDFEKILGKRASCEIDKDIQINKDMILNYNEEEIYIE